MDYIIEKSKSIFEFLGYLILLIILSLISTSSAAERMVLGELATNTSCDLCRHADSTITAIIENMSNNLAIIRYHTWWPEPADPYYEYNSNENRSRIIYYEINTVPYFYIDGTVDGGFSFGAWAGQIENEAAILAPVAIELSGTFDSDGRTGTINVHVIVEETPAQSNLKLRISVIEDGIIWSAPNGLDQHDQVFRDMIPGAGGLAVVLTEGMDTTYTYTLNTPTPINYNNAKIVVFIQSDSGRRVVNAAKISIPSLSPVGVNDPPTVPNNFALAQNYPNPFNAETRIEFETPGENIRLQIYDLTGSLVKTLISGHMNAGTHSIVWNGTNDNGSLVGSGVYFYRLIGENQTKVMRMTMLK